ncbi:MAG: HAD family hydrolase [Candidatus Merdivicinus sp.]|jgi:phosphoglycolate phosphatase
MEIIWDWNGTLFDDIATGPAVLNTMLIKRGKPPLRDLEQYREIFQFPVENYYRAAGLDFSCETFESMAEDYFALYPIASRDCGLMDGAKETLEAFRQAGFGQNILSASEQGLLESQLSRLGVREYFTHIIGQEDGYAVGKTERGIRWMLEEGISPESCVLIGDTDHDAQTATKLGCRCVLLSCGHQSRKRLETTGVPVLDSLKAVQKYIRNI